MANILSNNSILRMHFPTYLILVTLLFCSSSFANNWVAESFVESKADYSDNIFLTEENTEGSSVFQVNPSLHLSVEGKRTKSSLDYSLQKLFYSHKDIEDEIYHQAAASFSYELLDDAITFYFDSALGQDSEDIYRGINNDNVSDPDNIANVFRATSGILWIQDFKKKANIYLDASIDYINQQSLLPDDKGWDVTFNSSSSYQISSGFWQLKYQGSRRIPEDTDPSLLQSAQIQFGPQIAPHVALFSNFNIEQNIVPDSSSDNSLNTASIGPGLRWQPNKRTLFSLAYNVGVINDTPNSWSANFSLKPNSRVLINGSYGERFYGKAYNFELRYERKKTRTSLIYTESLSSYSRDTGLTQSIFDKIGDIDGVDIDESDYDKISYNSTNNSDIYLNKNAVWSTSRYSGRHTITANFSYSEKDYINQFQEERDGSVQINWNLNLGPRTSTAIEGFYQRLRTSQSINSIEPLETVLYTNIWQTRFTITRKLSRHSILTFEYLHDVNDGITNVESYVDNRVGLSYTLTTAN